MANCRLCKCENVPLKESHIVSKMFYNVIKKKSPTGIMRQVSAPNKGVQDGMKVPLLCERNEGEIYFNSKEDYISFFLLSIAWRVIQYISENNETTFTKNEKDEIERIIEKWRVILDAENMKKIREIQQFIIPTKNLKFFQNNKRRIWDNVMFDFKTFDEEDTFKFAFTIVQVPYFIFITTVWGETDGMKQYRLGKMIKPRKSELPQNISSLLVDKHYNEFVKAYEEISEKQMRIIESRGKSKADKF